MSFNITLYRNESEVNKVGKNLTTLFTVSGTLKEETSIINPVFLLDIPISDLKLANYISVPEFSRLYFIQDIVSVTRSLTEVSCHVDVLESFKDEIKANKAIIFRQENEWNLYLNDGVLEVYQNPIVTTHEFPNGFTDESYVLTLAGRPAESLSYGTSTIPPGGVMIGAGGSGDNVKTLAGLAAYAQAQLGLPYWFGTYGQVADVDLLRNRMSAYPSYYTKTSTEYAAEMGKRVHDCVGLIKGYRWSDTPTSVPTYELLQDVSAEGLFGECIRYKGYIGDDEWNNTFSTIPGVCVFFEGFPHVGVSMGDGTVIEAKGAAYGVVQDNISNRPWYWWGVPDWLINNTGIPVQ